jgi:hypothetical protein
MAVIYPGRGTLFKMSTANGSTVLSAMVQVVDVQPPQPSNPPIDITVLSSTWRTFMGTVPDGGTVTVSLLWDQADIDHQRLASLITASTPEEYRIVGPTTTRCTHFAAIVADFQPQQIVVDNVYRANASLKVTGAVNFTTA